MTSPKLRLDRSRYHSTVHGERAPGDRHQLAHYLQDGIYFDAQGLHIEELIENDKQRALVDKRLKRQGKASGPKAEEDPAEAADGDDDSEPKETGSSDVNLEAWLLGEAKYPWFAVTKAVRDRYSQNITKQVDMIEFLVEDVKLVTPDRLAPEYAALLKA